MPCCLPFVLVGHNVLEYWELIIPLSKVELNVVENAELAGSNVSTLPVFNSGTVKAVSMENPESNIFGKFLLILMESCREITN